MVYYLQQGLELNFSVAIDFTGSNGTPSSPTSLHYLNPMAPNQVGVWRGCVFCRTGRVVVER